MPWLRVGDTAATHPKVLAIMEHPAADVPHALHLELFGFVTVCATMAAQHVTDYVVSFPAAVTAAGSRQRAAELLDLAEWAGYGVNSTDDNGRRVFTLTEDPDLLHMRTADELAAEKQRRTDTGNPAITVPVRHRDGDSCRYCGVPVLLSDRKGARGLTYDHRSPLTQPATVESLVVACKGCNSARGAIAQQYDDHAAGLAAADAVHPLRPVPAVPHYSRATLALFDKHAAILNHSQPAPSNAPADDRQIIGRSSADTGESQQIGSGSPGTGGYDGSGSPGRERVGSREGSREGKARAGQRPQPHRRKGRGRR